ncbi:Protein K04E7.1, partial [Aphelenchoides avenae]
MSSKQPSIKTSVVATATKPGNVVELLNALYASGFATMSPTTPMLTGKVAHALYALSFLIYSTNTACDWLHVYCVLRGYVTSFTLMTWFAVYLTCAVVAGTMLNGLLM